MDCLDGLRLVPSDSVDCCITSPPYFGLRDYGVEGQIGLEPSPDEYISRLAQVFSEVLRVLKPEGTLWLNIGDSYNGYKGNANQTNAETMYAGHRHQPTRKPHHGLEDKLLKPKDLIGIPWMLAFALRDMGFYLRQDIIWHKPNPMPESITDRCVKSHEYLFLLSKSQKYHFDYEAIQENAVCTEDRRAGKGRIEYGGKRATGGGKIRTNISFVTINTRRRKRDVWTVPVKATKDAHFATFPKELIRDCVLAGCPSGGVILDPFMGTGTTAAVALEYGRKYIGFELNADYFEIINKKIQVTPDLFY